MTSCADNAAFILENYDAGIRRIPLWELGLSWLSRPISSKHMSALGRRINFTDHFHRFKYECGYAHEPDPANPSRVYETTLQTTEKDALFARARRTMIFGSFGKTQLLFYLHAMADARLWDHDQSVMKVSPGDKEQQEHIKHGMHMRT